MPILQRIVSFFRPATPTITAPSLLQLQEIREAMSDSPMFGWEPCDIEAALADLERGSFGRPEQLFQSLLRDPRIGGAAEKRANAVRQFDFSLECREDAPDLLKAKAEELQAVWEADVLTPAQRSEIMLRLAFFGFVIARKRQTWSDEAGQRVTRLEVWTHGTLHYDEQLRCYRGTAFDGTEVIIPELGDQNWAVFTTGERYPWMRGSLRRLGWTWFMINHTLQRWLLSNDVQAIGQKVLKAPNVKRESTEVAKAVQLLRLLRNNDVFLLPDNWELELLESRREGVEETFLKLLNILYANVAISMLGHNLAMETKSGSLAATVEAMDVARDTSIVDAICLRGPLRVLLREWVCYNFDPTLYDLPRSIVYYAPIPCFDFEEEEDESELADVAQKNAQATKTFIEALSSARVKIKTVGIDWREQAKRCGQALLPVEAGKNQPEVEYEEAPEQQPQALPQARGARALMSGEAVSDLSGLMDGQAYVDSLVIVDATQNALYLRAVRAAQPEFAALRAAIRDSYARANPAPLAERLAEVLALAELAAWYSLAIDSPVMDAPALMNSGSWGVPRVFARAVSWFKGRLASAGAVPVEYEFAAEADHKARKTAPAAQLDTASRLLESIDRAERAQVDPAQAQGELADLIARLGTSPTMRPADESVPLREELQKSFARTRTEILSLDFYRAAYPAWRYTSVLDDRTTEGCRALDGLTMPAKDPRWLGHVPPRHWHCRAHIEAVVDSALAQAGLTTPPPGTSGEGTFGTLRDDWEPRPGDYPPELWDIYAGAMGIADPHVELGGKWWRKDWTGE